MTNTAAAHTDAALVSKYGSDTAAYREVRERINALSGYFYGATVWGASGGDSRTYLGPVLVMLSDQDHVIDPADAETLTAAMLTFAARFCPAPPVASTFPGTVVADVLDDDCGAATDIRIVYTPDGAHAKCVDARYGLHVLNSGSLSEVLTAVLSRYQAAQQTLRTA